MATAIRVTESNKPTNRSQPKKARSSKRRARREETAVLALPQRFPVAPETLNRLSRQATDQRESRAEIRARSDAYDHFKETPEYQAEIDYLFALDNLSDEDLEALFAAEVGNTPRSRQTEKQRWIARVARERFAPYDKKAPKIDASVVTREEWTLLRRVMPLVFNAVDVGGRSLRQRHSARTIRRLCEGRRFPGWMMCAQLFDLLRLASPKTLQLARIRLMLVHLLRLETLVSTESQRWLRYRATGRRTPAVVPRNAVERERRIAVNREERKWRVQKIMELYERHEREELRRVARPMPAADMRSEDGPVAQAKEAVPLTGAPGSAIELSLDTYDDGHTLLFVSWPATGGWSRDEELCVPVDAKTLRDFAAAIGRLAERAAGAENDVDCGFEIQPRRGDNYYGDGSPIFSLDVDTSRTSVAFESHQRYTITADSLDELRALGGEIVRACDRPLHVEDIGSMRR
jgi:hypothetical protein